MKQSTVVALLRAYSSLQEIVIYLYDEFQKAMENRDDADTRLLETRAEILFAASRSDYSCFGVTKWIEKKHFP